MGPEDADAFQFDLAAASLRADGPDVRMMLDVLAKTLQDALGRRLVVERSRGLRKRSGEMKALEVTLGDDHLRADVEGETVRCSVSHTSGGIRIRSTQVAMDEWLRLLVQGLQAEADHSEQLRLALEHIVIGGAS